MRMKNYKVHIDREEYDQVITDHNEEVKLMERCPFMKTILGRDDKGNEDGELDWCKEDDRPCVLMSENDCETRNKIQEEEMC